MTVPTSPAALSVFAPGCLAGRHALITGGGSGIGQATAWLLADLGASVTVVGAGPEPLAQTAERHPDLISTATADLREPDQVDAMLEGAGVRFPAQQCWRPVRGSGPGHQLQRFSAVTRLNLDAPWYLTTQVANRFFIPAQYGKVVSITMTPPRDAVDGALPRRPAPVGITDEELGSRMGGRFGIRAVALAPGIVHTEAWQRYGPSPEQVGGGLPAGRLQTADEVAAMATFLFPAGDYITGNNLHLRWRLRHHRTDDVGRLTDSRRCIAAGVGRSLMSHPGTEVTMHKLPVELSAFHRRDLSLAGFLLHGRWPDPRWNGRRSSHSQCASPPSPASSPRRPCSAPWTTSLRSEIPMLWA